MVNDTHTRRLIQTKLVIKLSLLFCTCGQTAVTHSSLCLSVCLTVFVWNCDAVGRDFLRLGAPLFCAAESEEQQQDAKRLADMLTGRTFAGTIDKLHPVSSSSSLLSNADTSPSPVDVVTGNSLKTTSTDTVVSSVSKPSASLTPVNGGPVLLTRVKCLVSMTTPRDIRLHGAAITPSFVEFDMSCEGFGCMYLPSIAPQGPITPSVVSAGMIGGTDQNVVTGIGTGMPCFLTVRDNFLGLC